jgi:hypothetical protein
MRRRNSSLTGGIGRFLMHTERQELQPIASLLSRVIERASRLDRRADNELAEGHHVVAERLAMLAAELRLEAAL